MRKISRRALIGGGAAALALGGTALEVASLSGRFDHRRSPGASANDRWVASLAEADRRDAIVHVGHSTHLVALAGVRLLTDPWFYDPAFGALSHERAPAVLPEHIGRLDALLVTHDHADHADLRAIDRLDKRAAAIVATPELAAKIRSRGFGDVSVLSPWEEKRVGAVSVTAVPALHDIYEIGFVLRANGRSVYFAGDTRLHPEMPAIAERLAPSAAILPVDGTRLVGGGLHVMTPEHAVLAARTLRCTLVMPSHDEAVFSDPLAKHVLASTVEGARYLFAERVARDLPGVRCALAQPGGLVPLDLG